MHISAPARSIAYLALSALALVACSHDDTPGDAAGAPAPTTTQQAQPPAPSTTSAAASDAPLELCTLMPVDTVSRILQASIGKSVSVATPHTGGMCAYQDVATGVPKVQVLIDFTRHDTPAAAATALHSAWQQGTDLGVRIVDIPNLGAGAFGSSDSPESFGVKTERGVFMGQVNVKVDGSTPEALRPAAVELAKATLARLP